MRGVWQTLYSEIAEYHVRLQLAQMAMWPLPPHVGNRLRVYLLRLAGFQIGRGTVMWGPPLITGSGELYSRLRVGCDCWFNVGCLLNLGATIGIGDRVAVGHQVMILTDTHAIGDQCRRAGPLKALPVHIDDGAWIGARAILLPGVTIGAGAVVAAGAVVTKAVAPHTLVGGTPARPIRNLPTAEDKRHQILPGMTFSATATKELSCETV